MDHNGGGRAADKEIAVGAERASRVLPGRTDDRPLRIQPVSAVQKVLRHGADGRFAQTGADDQSDHCSECR